MTKQEAIKQIEDLETFLIEEFDDEEITDDIKALDLAIIALDIMEEDTE